MSQNIVHISDLIFYDKSYEEIINFLKKNNIKKLEFFIEPLDEEYTKKMLKILNEYKFESISFHGPFRKCNMADLSSNSWEKTLYSYTESFKMASKYNPKFMVLHTNEGIPGKIIDDNLKIEILNQVSHIVNEGKKYGIDVVIENVGIRENMVFSQREYEEFILKNKYKCLIDIGHAYLNEWNIESLIKNLKNNILGFHFHNNDGLYDRHDPISIGKIDYSKIIKLVKENVPTGVIVLEYDFSKDKNILLKDWKELEKNLEL